MFSVQRSVFTQLLLPWPVTCPRKPFSDIQKTIPPQRSFPAGGPSRLGEVVEELDEGEEEGDDDETDDQT